MLKVLRNFLRKFYPRVRRAEIRTRCVSSFRQCTVVTICGAAGGVPRSLLQLRDVSWIGLRAGWSTRAVCCDRQLTKADALNQWYTYPARYAKSHYEWGEGAIWTARVRDIPKYDFHLNGDSESDICRNVEYCSHISRNVEYCSHICRNVEYCSHTCKNV